MFFDSVNTEKDISFSIYSYEVHNKWRTNSSIKLSGSFGNSDKTYAYEKLQFNNLSDFLTHHFKQPNPHPVMFDDAIRTVAIYGFENGLLY